MKPGKLWLPLSCIIILPLVASCSLDVDFPKRVALVYGAADYQYINSLNWTDDDAAEMAIELHKKGFEVHLRIDNGNIAFSGLVSGEALSNSGFESTDVKAVTKTQIKNDMETIGASLSRDDLLLVYFSGHGETQSRIEDIYPSDNSSYLLPIEVEGVYNQALSEYVANPETAVSDNEISQWFSDIAAKKKIFITDICFSGGFIGESYTVDAYPETWNGEAILPPTFSQVFTNYSVDTSSNGIGYSEAVVITASGSMEESYEDAELKNGYFTYVLLDGFSRGDQNGDGYITAQELYAHANEGLRNLRKELSIAYYLPHISGSPVDFVLFRAD